MEKEHPYLRDHLAVSVRKIQWSYSIFWSISPFHPGVLEWGEGYYNGDTKTRKTVQATEFFNVDERSEQLRELYESLLAGKSDPHARRPCAALSPEDLSDTEWYYMVCMSFVFNPGQGLPGRSLLNGTPIWIHNAHRADSKVFCRSLLAKSASIQTVVCFPLLGGVVELGVTDSVEEDLPLIHYVQASLMGNDCPILLQRPSSLAQLHNNQIDDNAVTEIVQHDGLSLLESPSDSSCDSFGLIAPERAATFCTNGNESTNSEIQGADDLHYRNVLSSLSNSTHQLVLGSSINFDKQSCFLSLEKGGSIDIGVHQRPTNQTPQRMLKSILFDVPQMHTLPSIQCENEEDGMEKVDDRFSVLQSLLPSINKVERSSILDDAITYIKELEKRVEELEARINSFGDGSGEKAQDSDKSDRVGGIKRKACHGDEDNVSVRLIGKAVSIDIRCQWKERLLVQLIDALSIRRLHPHSVQASINDGLLRVTIETEIDEPTSLSAGMIRQVLERAIMK